jgi:hypothetical protein
MRSLDGVELWGGVPRDPASTLAMSASVTHTYLPFSLERT